MLSLNRTEHQVLSDGLKIFTKINVDSKWLGSLAQNSLDLPSPLGHNVAQGRNFMTIKQNTVVRARIDGQVKAEA